MIPDGCSRKKHHVLLCWGKRPMYASMMACSEAEMANTIMILRYRAASDGRRKRRRLRETYVAIPVIDQRND
jgi:hypothetical protein